jgi:hypothetical protein
LLILLLTVDQKMLHLVGLDFQTTVYRLLCDSRDKVKQAMRHGDLMLVKEKEKE